MRWHSLFDELDASLAAMLPGEPVELAGRWYRSSRRIYREGSQSGTGSGPFVEVVDLRWRGSLTCEEPIAGLAFLAAASELSWAKTAVVGSVLDVEVSLSVYADHSPLRATFTARVGDAWLPGVAVGAGVDLTAVCTLREARVTTALVAPLAHTAEASFAVLLIPRRFITIGRHRLWRVREEVASSVPPHVRDILTRGRTGSLP